MCAALAGAVGVPGREGIGSGQSYAFLHEAAVPVGPQQLRVHLGAGEGEFLRIRAWRCHEQRKARSEPPNRPAATVPSPRAGWRG